MLYRISWRRIVATKFCQPKQLRAWMYEGRSLSDCAVSSTAGLPKAGASDDLLLSFPGLITEFCRPEVTVRQALRNNDSELCLVIPPHSGRSPPPSVRNDKSGVCRKPQLTKTIDYCYTPPKAPLPGDAAPSCLPGSPATKQ